MYRVLIGGVTLLAIAGVFQLWKGRLAPDQPLRQELLWDEQGVFTKREEISLSAISSDREKLANLVIVTCELLVMVMAGGMLLYVVAVSAVPLVAVPPLVATYLIGAYLLGRAVYLRLGLDDTPGGPGRVRTEALIADQFGNEAESEFAAVTAALSSARSTSGVDDHNEATALVLTGVSGGATPEELRSVAEDSGIASSAVDETIDALVAGGLVAAPEAGKPLSFTDDRLEDAEPDQVAAMATAVAS